MHRLRRHSRERIRYLAFRTIRLYASTEVAEGHCKNIVGSRLKRGGMRWTGYGVNVMLIPRCVILSNTLFPDNIGPKLLANNLRFTRFFVG